MKRIRLRVSGVEGREHETWPLTQGIPFAEGDLERGTPVRVVDGDGKPLPTQSAPLATWDKEGRSVRFLLIDFQRDGSSAADAPFFLEYGAEAVPPDSPDAIRVDQTGSLSTGPEDRFRLDTGVLRFEWRTGSKTQRGPDWFANCQVKGPTGWQETLAGTPGPFLYLCDQHGTEYRSNHPGPWPQVSIEESGPLRVALCVRGYHHSAQGVRFCPYVLRLHFFAGRRDIRIFHTFIFDQDPQAVELSAIGLRVPFRFTGDLRAAVAGDTVPGSRPAYSAGRGSALSAFQPDDLTYLVTQDGCPVWQGARGAGWASVRGDGGAALAVVRDFWQEYPKGFALRGAEMDIGIWPGQSPARLAFTTPFTEEAIRFGHTRDEETFKTLLAERPSAPLNLKSLNIQAPADLEWMERMLARHAPHRVASHNDTGTENGLGAAKTTEIWLRVRADTIEDAEAGAFALAVQAPPIAPADPAYACATRAFGGRFYHAGDPLFAEVDAGLDFLVASVALEPIDTCRLYGMMRYGNMVCSHSAGPPVAYVHYKDTRPDLALRHVGPYNNEANDQIMGVWGNFLRTGRREHLFLAQRYSRAVADVGICHADPVRSWRVGLMHYHNAHQWTGDLSPSHTLVTGLLTDYYLTGHRRLLDVAREVADWAVRTQEPCGIVSNRYGALHREFTGPLWCLVEVYRATWEERYGDVARRSLHWLLRVLPEPGVLPGDLYTRGERGDEAVVGRGWGRTEHGARDTYHLYEGALRCFDSPALRAHILQTARHIVEEEITDNFATREMVPAYDSPARFWPVDDTWYWTQWGVMFGGGWSIPLLGLAYDLTGDLTYAAFAKDHLFGFFLRQVERCRHFADWRFTWICFGSYIPRLMSLVADALRRDPEGLARAEAAWRRQRAQRGMPVYAGPNIDFSRDTMGVNGQILNRPPADIPRPAAAPPPPERSLGRLPVEDLLPADGPAGPSQEVPRRSA